MSIRYLTIHGTYTSIRLRNAALCIVALCIGLGQQPTFPISNLSPSPRPLLFLTKVRREGEGGGGVLSLGRLSLFVRRRNLKRGRKSREFEKKFVGYLTCMLRLSALRVLLIFSFRLCSIGGGGGC